MFKYRELGPIRGVNSRVCTEAGVGSCWATGRGKFGR